jgi:hypothetical protein
MRGTYLDIAGPSRDERRVLVLALATLVAAAPQSPELTHAKKLDPLLGAPVEAARKQLGCPEAWRESNAKTPAGVAYVVHRCVPNENQLYALDGRVFAVGVRLEAGLDGKVSTTKHKAAAPALEAAGCKVDPRGQLVLAQCPPDKVMALLENWDSQVNTHSRSMLYGQARALGPLLGLHDH